MNGRYNRSIMLRSLRRILAIIFLVIAVGMLVWASVPNPREIVSQAITPGMMLLDTYGTPLSISAREIRLEWPRHMRIDEDEIITLRFIPLQPDQARHDPSIDYTDMYSKFSLMAEGRYDVAGLKVNPANPTRESMPASQPLTFRWRVSTNKEGVYNGTVWLSLRYLPLDGSQSLQQPIYIHDIKIQAISLFGLNENLAFLLAGVWIILCVVIVYDDVVRFVKKVVRKIQVSRKTLRKINRFMEIKYA